MGPEEQQSQGTGHQEPQILYHAEQEDRGAPDERPQQRDHEEMPGDRPHGPEEQAEGVDRGRTRHAQDRDLPRWVTQRQALEGIDDEGVGHQQAADPTVPAAGSADLETVSADPVTDEQRALEDE